MHSKHKPFPQKKQPIARENGRNGSGKKRTENTGKWCSDLSNDAKNNKEERLKTFQSLRVYMHSQILNNESMDVEEKNIK